MSDFAKILIVDDNPKYLEEKWNYLLLLGICALFKKRALFFFLLWIKC